MKRHDTILSRSEMEEEYSWSGSAASGRCFPIVLVHGMNGGGWVWRFVLPFLQAQGYQVLTPTLSGFGNTALPLACDITLETHIRDVIAAIETSDLRNVVLVGHSYGGMVVTCVADRIRERIGRLVYLDALVARDGLSAFDLLPDGMAAIRRERVRVHGGNVAFPVPPETAVFLPDAERKAWFMRHLRPHPVGTYETAAHLSRPAGDGLPVSYIAYEQPALGSIEPSRAYARRQKAWRYRSEAVPHDAEIVFPEKVAAFITEAI